MTQIVSPDASSFSERNTVFKSIILVKIIAKELAFFDSPHCPLNTSHIISNACSDPMQKVSLLPLSGKEAQAQVE